MIPKTQLPRCSLVVALATILFILDVTDGADHSKFKNCDQSSACVRNRNHQSFEQDWALDMSTVQANGLNVAGQIYDHKNPSKRLSIILSMTGNGAIRMKIDELQPKRARLEAKEALNPKLSFRQLKIHEKSGDHCVFMFGSNSKNNDQTSRYRLVLKSHPFQADVYDSNDMIVVQLNSRGLMRYEFYQELHAPQQTPAPLYGAPKESQAYDEAGRPLTAEASSEELVTTEAPVQQPAIDSYSETFSTFTDLRPYGPMSVGMDIYFPNSDHIYGIPEHTDGFALQDTRPNLGDPYRLYNVDIFEYELNSRMSLYGAIPFMISQSKKVGSFGVFWLNPSETWIDVESNHSNARGAGVVGMLSSFVSSDKKMTGRLTHWFSETGLIDIWFMPGPEPTTVIGFNAEIFGTMPMAPVFSIGFHQCRWNYYSDSEVMQVDEGYDSANIPLDAIWLDIEYTTGRSKKYFTWDPITFSNPVQLAHNLSSKGRRLIAIIDPHIKREDGYDIYDEGTTLDVWVKDSSGQHSFDGWCWPGSSMWPDFLNPKVREWWSSKYDPKYFPGAPNAVVDIWNDMNEPSVFSGPEVTAPRDLRHIEGWEHRDLHNMYGHLVTMATYEGMAKFRKAANLDRPYILSRSFFAGTQRYASVWTGDNLASWDHLKVTVSMLLSISISGLPFVGADVGGFFNNPESDELLIRWHQAGAFQPFFRAHAHHDSKRREAYLFQGETRRLLRQAIKMKYTYSPYWYTLFFEAHVNGWPMMRPMWFHEHQDENTYDIEDQYLLGYSLLVKPIVDKGITSVSVYLPGVGGKTSWYDLNTQVMHSAGQHVKLAVSLATLPLFQRAGSIIPVQYRMRRSLDILMRDPITLEIVLEENAEGKTHAHGFLFMDDLRKLEPDSSSATLTDYLYDNEHLYVNSTTSAPLTNGVIERIVIHNWPVKKRLVSIESGSEATNYQDATKLSYQLEEPRPDGTSVLKIKKPQQVAEWRAWTVKFNVEA